MTPPLTTAYYVFAQYGLQPIRDADPHDCSAGDRTAERISDLLSRTPLAEVPEADLLDYFYLAIRHIGSIADFKHFLPRVLELMSSTHDGLLTSAVLVDKLSEAGFQSWPAAEQHAVRACIASAPEGTPLARIIGRV